MIEIIKELSVEVTKPNIFQALVAKQYDMNTRFLKVTLTDCGKRIDIPNIETARVVINAERKDGQSKGFDGVINDDGTVTVPLHSWMLELDGTVICDISVIDIAEGDNKKLTTTSFTLIVEKAAFGGEDITSDPQYDVLVALMDAATVAQEALDKSNEANAKYNDCVEATAKANKAAEEAEAVRDEVEAGGFIESLKELNAGEKFTFWVGTQAEYDSLTVKENNCFHVITDDDTEEGLEALAGAVESLNGTVEGLSGDVGTLKEKAFKAHGVFSNPAYPDHSVYLERYENGIQKAIYKTKFTTPINAAFGAVYVAPSAINFNIAASDGFASVFAVNNISIMSDSAVQASLVSFSTSNVVFQVTSPVVHESLSCWLIMEVIGTWK